jgi:hypothetical protein
MITRFARASVLIVAGSIFAHGGLASADSVTDTQKTEILIKRPESNLETMDSFTKENRYRKFGGAVGRLQMQFNGGDVGFCTGTLIGPDLAITAAHCLKDLENPAKPSLYSTVLYLEDVAPDDAGRGTPFTVELAPWEYDGSLDYAILHVAGSPGLQSQFTPAGIATRLPVPHEELFLVHHPQGQVQHLTRRACRVRGKNDANTVLHTCDTNQGSSGAALMSDNEMDGRILAIHTSWIQLGQDKLNVATTIAAITAKSCILKSIIAKTDYSMCPHAAAVTAQLAPSELVPGDIAYGR